MRYKDKTNSMITKLAIRNFKSIGEPGVEIDLKPLTIFLGPNASGKSNILEAIGLFSQSINKDIHCGGPLVEYRDFVDTIHKRETNRWLEIEVCTKIDEKETKQFLKIQDKLNVQLNNIGYRYSFKKLNDEAKHSIKIDNQEVIKVTNEFIEGVGRQDRFEYPPMLAFKPCGGDIRQLFDRRIFKAERIEEEALPFLDAAEKIIEIIRSKIEKKVIFISAVRGLVQEMVKAGGIPKDVGKHGEYLIHLLSFIFSSMQHKKQAIAIVEWANKFGIGELHAGWRGGDELISEYREPVFEVILNLAMASQGSKQILPVITQLFWSQPDDIIMIEEPEISLHPKSQVILTELFAKAISEGKQIIITTHSEFLPLAFRKPIEKGLLKLDDIAVYHIKKEKEGSVAEKLELTDEGYIKGWIPSFSEIEEKLLEEWIETVPEE